MKIERKRFAVAAIFTLALVGAAKAGTMGMKDLNQKNNAFVLKEAEPINEIGSTAYLYEHKKTGARVLYIQNDDENKVFSIGFRTPPEDSTGTPHILEHSVLCGSKKYPVKDPFLLMSKQSLYTFLNAITYPDMTIYPIASRNEKDFENLMNIYLDAVFYPNIYNNSCIFMQEGWHYEINDGKLSVNGVVYNEMKGAYASPTELLFEQIKKTLFPDNAYAFDSGGNPDVIPMLSQDKFLEMHRKYYHPSNSYIYLYGNLDITKVLKHLDQDYLSSFERNEAASKSTALPIQKSFDRQAEVVCTYPVSEKNKSAGTYLAISFVTDSVLEKKTMIELDLLNDLLMGTSASPLRKALTDARLGENVFSEFDTTLQQPVFSIVCENSAKTEKERFVQLVEQTLEKVVRDGFDQRLMEAALNSYEMNLREVNGAADRGLTYNEDCMKSWVHGGNPMEYLEFEKCLEEIKTNINAHYFDHLLKRFYINNTHSSLIVMEPMPGQEEANAVQEKAHWQSVLACMTEKEKQKIKEDTKKLRNWQNTPDDATAVATVPRLSLRDVDRTVKEIPNEVSLEDGVPVLKHVLYTNELTYMDFYFDTKSVPQEDLPYLLLLNTVLGAMGTQQYSYTELSNECGIVSGGVEYSIQTFSKFNDDREIRTFFDIGAFTTSEKLTSCMELIQEIICHTNFNDKKRLQELIQEAKTDLQNYFIENGSKVATRRVLSYFSPTGAYNDLGGLPYYQFLQDLDNNFETEYMHTVEKLREIAALVFVKDNLTIGVTTEEDNYRIFQSKLHHFIKGLDDTKFAKHTYYFPRKQKNEGLILSGKVQYVAQAYNFKRSGYDYSGKMQVLQNVIDNEYLWQEVRVKGGAYGIHIAFSPNGNLAISSYRDPKLAETLKVYQGIASFVEDFHADETDMESLIIGTIGQIDGLKSPWSKGRSADRMYFSGMRQEDRQRERDEILSTTPEEIRSFAPMLQDAIQKNYYVVVGNKSKIMQNQTQFGEIKELLK